MHMAAGGGNQTHETIITSFTVKGVPAAVIEMKKYQDAKTGLTRTEISKRKATEESSDATLIATYETRDLNFETKQAAKANKDFTKQLHMANMGVLGMNMSLLGITFQMRSLGFISKETANMWMQMIAPMQMVMSVMGLMMSMTQMLTMHMTRLQISITGVSLAAMGLLLFYGALMQKSTAMRFVLGALAGAITAVAVAYVAKFWAQAAAMALSTGTLATPLIMASVGIAAAAGGLLAAGMSTIKVPTQKAFSGRILNSPTALIGGEVPEAIIPLQSPKANRALSAPTGSVHIENATFVIKADSPATLYREMTRAVASRNYARAR